MTSSAIIPSARPSRLSTRLDPATAVLLLIGATLLLRIVFAAETGLGIDESYMVALSRDLHLGYFDHPPIAWWLAWLGAHVAASEAPLAVRLPFILLFAVSTWLMFRGTEGAFGARAGLWAAIAFNLAPQFGVTSASWVLPDGPMILALLGGVLCLQRALRVRPEASTSRWIAVGVAAGVALLSKYTSGLTIAGAALFLLTSPAHRHWLRRPQPYLAAAAALALFAPVILWNAQHGWASFAFQGGRALGARFRPFEPLQTLAGQALFLLPWLWVALAAAFVAAVRSGPRATRHWLFACLGALPLVLFVAVSAWTGKRILFHWAAPGYLMLFPLLGDWLAGLGAAAARRVRIGAAASTVFVLVAVVGVTSEIRFNWLPEIFGDFAGGRDPDLDAVDWVSIRSDLAARGLLGRQDVFVGATRWIAAGKLDYALGGAAPVICLCDDSREYGIVHPESGQVGHDAVIIAPRLSLAEARATFGSRFDAIEALEPVVILHDGRVAEQLSVFLGRHLHPPAPLAKLG